MLIANRRSFTLGVVLSLGFVCVLGLIFSPVFGGGRNGLQYADDVFNRLSKNSSYFIPKVARSAEKQAGTAIAVDIKLESAQQAGRAATLLAGAGAVVKQDGSALHVDADLGKLLGRCLSDAEDGYRNADGTLAERYGFGARDVLAGWWKVLRQIGKALAAQKRTAEADTVVEVMRKAVEPAHNYYGVEAGDVAAVAGTMTGLLVFYIAYTIWWGSAIYYLFEGIGLMMRKEAPAAAREPAPVAQS